MKRSIIYLLATLAIMGCHNESGHEEHEHEHEHAEAGAGSSNEIVFSEEKQALFGVRSEAVKAAPFCEIIHTGGSVLPDLGDESVVTAPASGIIIFAGKNISEGSPAGRGMKIASVSSKGISGGDVLAKSKASLDAAKKEYERDSIMVAENIVSVSHFEQSRLAYIQALNEYTALTSGGSDPNGVSVCSPISGYVKALHVKAGEYVEAGQPVATVSQNRSLRLRADVPERYASSLKNITDANFKTATGQTFNVKDLGGRVISFGKTSEDGYIPVTFEFQNREGITPGSYVEIWLKGASEGDVIAIPADAVTEDQGTYSVYLRLDEDCFRKQEVSLGATDGRSVVIKSGLKDGDDTVVSGAMQIKLASVAAVPAGHNHNH